MISFPSFGFCFNHGLLLQAGVWVSKRVVGAPLGTVLPEAAHEATQAHATEA